MKESKKKSLETFVSNSWKNNFYVVPNCSYCTGGGLHFPGTQKELNPRNPKGQHVRVRITIEEISYKWR